MSPSDRCTATAAAVISASITADEAASRPHRRVRTLIRVATSATSATTAMGNESRTPCAGPSFGGGPAEREGGPDPGRQEEHPVTGHPDVMGKRRAAREHPASTGHAHL